MREFIFFRDIFFNIKHVVNVEIKETTINITTIDGIKNSWQEVRANKVPSYFEYTKAEKHQLLKDLNALTFSAT
jgi:hypothetical protein